MRIPVKGLKELDDDNFETTYYYNRDLLKNGVYFKEITLEDEKKEGENFIRINTMIHVVFTEEKEVDDENYIEKAQWFILYWDELLAPIQLYRILKDVYDLYLDNTLEDFFEIIENLSIAHAGSNDHPDYIAEAEYELDHIWSNSDFS